jgi:GT2 family glycosyltransferase
MLSIVIVSYNTRELLARCLETVYAADPIALEVIVVDNASRDASVAMLREHFPEIVVIQNEVNRGFAAATNQGLARAGGRYVLLLNSDTEVSQGAWGQLIAFMDQHPAAGALGPRLLNSDGSLQRTAKRFPSPLSALFGRKSVLTHWFPHNRFSRAYLLELDESRAEPFEADCLSGACLLVRREVLEQVGPLDEQFFMYWEDNDWCYRIKAAGWQIYALPTVRVVHHEGQSSRGHPTRHIIAFHRSVYRYVCKHVARAWWDLRRPLILCALIIRAALVSLGQEARWATGHWQAVRTRRFQVKE